MIFKEENIMIPMLVEVMTQDEWKLVSDESSEIGFIISDIAEWKPIVSDYVPTEKIVDKVGMYRIVIHQQVFMLLKNWWRTLKLGLKIKKTFGLRQIGGVK